MITHQFSLPCDEDGNILPPEPFEVQAARLADARLSAIQDLLLGMLKAQGLDPVGITGRRYTYVEGYGFDVHEAKERP